MLAAQLMLEHKRIDYRRRDLPNQLHGLVLPLLGYRARTVPVLRLGGVRLQGTRTIARALDATRAEPRLLPLDPRARRAVEEAEAWADGELQTCARTLGRWAAKRDPEALWSFARDSYLPYPRGLLRAILPVLGPAVLSMMSVPDEAARGCLAALPAHLDRIDELIAAGVVGGDHPNAADFQIATSVRLLLLFDDLQAAIEPRPAGRLARRIAPRYPGRFRSVFPAAWLGSNETSAKSQTRR